LPEGEANSVQSEARESLLTEKATGELAAENPAESVTFAERECGPLERALVWREAFEDAPLSTETWTEARETESEAVPEKATVMRVDDALAGARLLPIEIKKRINVPQDSRADFLAFNETPPRCLLVFADVRGRLDHAWAL